MTKATPELTPALQTSAPYQREDVCPAPLLMMYVQRSHVHGGSSVESFFELGVVRPRSRDLTTRPFPLTGDITNMGGGERTCRISKQSLDSRWDILKVWVELPLPIIILPIIAPVPFDTHNGGYNAVATVPD
ncbi:hypothetical protein AVEN_199807-1 [Araneus ventricosus]|uniref:Uncharacterized protein n=1 Tax=Araneus ventricosus TaxID=182803 RepID=A0A4Y2J9N0_ARAVE|nr:hypothetical protein AVEN_199807-1 [Araneus ventricosus]